MTYIRIVPALLLAVVPALGCAKQEVATPAASVAPSLVVEQFLRAANAKNLDTMARLFGTKEGPIINRDTKADVERRMFTIASVLRHEDFEIQSERLVPGRTNEATQLMVRMRISGRNYSVPFTLVRYREGTWLVEQIGLEVITAGA